MDRHRVSLPPEHHAVADDALNDEPAMTSRPDALPPGAKLEEFQIERVIGSSGFGIVYLANDDAFERRVAIKEYLPDTLALRGEDGAQVLLRAASHADAFERGRRAFVEESQLLARCEHPSLVHVLRSGEAHGTVYRVMPHYPGHTLLALRQAMQGPPDEASLRALLDGLLSALEALHDTGALHGEVTPSNILLLSDDRPLLLDTSATKRAIVGDQARALLTLLAPSFAPAEQISPAEDRPLGPWTDVYSLAAVVRYCISGKLPPATTMYAPQRMEPLGALVRRLQERHPLLHYGAPFLAALDAALQIEPAERPQSVAEFRALLDQRVPLEGHRAEPLFTDSGEIPLVDDEPLWGPLFTPEPTPPVLTPTAPPVRAAAPQAAAEPAPPRAPAAQAATPEPVVPPSLSPPTPPASTPSAVPPSSRAAAPERPRVAEPVRAAPTARAEPVMAAAEPPPAAPWSARPGEERPLPVFSYAETSRRHRRRVALAGTLVVMLAAAGGAWMIDQQRHSTEAQSAFAQAARQDGLTANVPAVPHVADVAPAPSPAASQSALPETPTAAVVAAATPVPDTPAATQQAAPSVASSGTEATQVASAASPVIEEDEAAAVDSKAAAPAPHAAPAKRGATRNAAPAARSGHAAPSRSAALSSPVERISSPREACGNRTQFSLYRCMQTQCAQPQWVQHPLCKRLRIRDEVE